MLKENSLFTYKFWDIQRNSPLFGYFDVTLKVPIKDFPVGTYFYLANINYETSTIEFYVKGEYSIKVKFDLQVL